MRRILGDYNVRRGPAAKIAFNVITVTSSAFAGVLPSGDRCRVPWAELSGRGAWSGVSVPSAIGTVICERAAVLSVR